MDFVTVCTPEGESQRFELALPALRIGRSSGSDLVLHDLNVSRLHAEIMRCPDGFYLRDAGGKNGTFLNEERIAAPALLRSGDRIRLGTTTLIFNGVPTSRVEFSDRPLPAGSATRFLPAGEILGRPWLRTPSVETGSLALPGAARAAPAPAAAAPGIEAGPGPSAGFLKVISEADQELVFHRPLDEILETILDLAARAVRFERGLLVLREGDQLVPRVVRVPLGEAGRTISISRTITERVIRHLESVLTSDALLDERFKGGKSVEAQHIRSVMCVPLWNNRDVIGLIYVDSRHQPGLFNEEALFLLTHLANVAAVKIENARLFAQALGADRMEQELRKAAEIQNRLLPTAAPSIEGYSLYGCSVPCREVGGDSFDYIELPGGRCGVGLADVAGKGLPAALLITCFQASLRVLCELDLPPADTLARLNRILLPRIPPNRFVTSFYAVLDPSRHTLTYASAGHNPPLLVRRGRGAKRLSLGGVPLGLFEEARYGAATVRLEPGDFVLCYSDGVTEGSNAAGEEFGEHRLVAVARAAKRETPAAICERITAEIQRHHQGAPRQDDVTMVVLKRMA